MEGLVTLAQSVLTQNKRILMMKNLAVIRKIKRIRSYTRKSFRKIRKTFTPKKTVKMLKSYSWVLKAKSPEEEIEDVVYI